MKKSGFVLIALLIFSFILVLAILFGIQRQKVYIAYQNFGNKLGHNFNNIASQSYVDFIKSQDGKKENSQTGTFLGKEVAVADASLLDADVLGSNTVDDNKWIEVDLSEQKLYLKEGDKTTSTFLVSTGKWAPTPTGEWRIWSKLRYTRMSGGSKALGTYYNLPNVPYTMFYNQGYGIHGAYWHSNFGTPMSHGCVNMKPEEAGIVYNWASVGTRVVIHG